MTKEHKGCIFVKSHRRYKDYPAPMGHKVRGYYRRKKVKAKLDANKIEKKIEQIAKGKKYADTCPVCKYGWKGYRGNYDELCTKHYLIAEPTK